MIHRPWVIKRSRNQWEIVTGFRRVLALAQLGHDVCPVIDVSDINVSPMELFRVHLFENMATRRLNDIEKAMVLDHLSAWLSTNDISQHYMPLLGLPPKVDVLNTYRRLHELEEPAKKWFANKGVSLKMMALLAGMDDSEVLTLLNWIGKLKLNMNYQYEYIELIIEISLREGLSTTQVLAEEPYSGIVQNLEEKISLNAKSILKALKIRRFPRIEQAEKRFSEALFKLALPEGVKVDHSPYFESPEYRLTITYEQGEALKSKIQYLARLENLEEMVVTWEDLPS
jgi:hypothetical protein